MKDQIPELAGTKSHFQNNSSTRKGYESEAFEIWGPKFLRLNFYFRKILRSGCSSSTLAFRPPIFAGS